MKKEIISREERINFATASREIVNAFLSGEIQTEKDLEHKKREICRRIKLSNFPSNSIILQFISPNDREQLSAAHMDILRKKPSRTMSGISVVAVMTPPAPCPGRTPNLSAPPPPLGSDLGNGSKTCG